MAKQLSDVVRDKIIKARKGRTDASLGNPVILTDREACNLWSSLMEVEMEINNLETVVLDVAKERFKRVKKSLSAVKKEIIVLKKRSKKRKSK